MKRLQILWAVPLALSLSLPLRADEASAAFKQGTHAESEGKYDEAFEGYSKAHALKPKDAKYFTSYTRLRFYAAVEHIRQGQLYRDSGKLQEALGEFQRAADIDHTNFVAKEEARRTAEMLRRQKQPEAAPPAESPLDKMVEEAEGPVELVPMSNTLINLRLTESSTMVYKTIAKLAGINVLFDPDYKPTKISVELNDVTLREALKVVALQTKTFWQPTSSNTILVAADSKRKELQDTAMKTFYLRNVGTTQELQEAATTLKGILDVTRLQLIPNQNAIIVRGTQDQLVLAEKLLTDIDKPKPEVVIDIAVLQVSRDRIKTLGVNPPTSASVALAPNSSAGTGTTGSSGGGWTINSLASGINATNFQVSFPGASMSVLMSDSDTKLLQNPEIRALDNEKATLKIGDRVPVATGSFGAAAGGGGVSALVNTQFQYLDVGVNIDITPHIHSEHEVTLKMTLEVSSVSGTQNIGGISQPVIGQRRIEHETRLQDGEVNLVGGILEDTETHSLAGYPWLTKIPILKYLFGQEDKERQENEIVFAITPHIVRAQSVTEDNLRLVDLGAGNSVSVRYKDPRKSASQTPGPMQQTSSPNAPVRTPGTRAATPVPVVPQTTPDSSKAPATAAPGTTTTSSLIAPAKSPPPNSAVRPAQPGVAPPAAAQAAADPCPYGQHATGQENGVTTCAFN